MDLIRCTRCVKQVPPQSRFCRRCGCSIRSPRPTQTATAPKPTIPARTQPQQPRPGGFVFAAFVAIAAPIFLMSLLSRSVRHEPRLEYVPFMSAPSAVNYDRATPSSGIMQPSRMNHPVIVQPQPFNNPIPPGFDQQGRWVGIDAAGRTMVRPGEPQPTPYGPRTTTPNGTNHGAPPANRR